MAWKLLLLACALALIGSVARAAIVEHTFKVGNKSTRKLCKQSVVTVVNGRLPGPIIRAHDGDTVIVHVLNNSPYNITIHWHGIFQLLSGWADGPNYVTQCPIIPGGRYTYRFNITGQEGTLWWHAHVSYLRATVYGALIIKPRAGTKAYPFATPYKEVPILLGEWWDANVVDVAKEAMATGGAPNISDAFTINGRPGDLYRCSSEKTYKLHVVTGETYMLRIINAALNHQLFFKVAGHSMTVVAIDASYTTPYSTDVVAIAPGQTVDALMRADAPPGGRYYMAARAYISANIAFDNTTTTAIVHYTESSSHKYSPPPVMPSMPAFNDTPTANTFYTSLTGLLHHQTSVVPPLHVDEHMFVTFGLGLVPCGRNQPRCRGQALAASMNNVSFQFPTQISLLEASFKGTSNVYTRDFPDRPPLVFDYTNTTGSSVMLPLATTAKGTKVKRVKFNSTVEMVLQNTALLGAENHPLHLHGFNFFVLAQGLGNFNYNSSFNYNLVNPQVRNTIAVPAGGWAVIRFKADNPGVWIMHCHLDVHLPWGLATAFEVENGPTPASTLPPPPPDFPRC